MDKRTLTALVLMALVIVVTPMLFPGTRQAPVAGRATTAAAPASGKAVSGAAPTQAIAPAATKPQPAISAASQPATGQAPSPSLVAESTVVVAPKAQVVVVSPGAVPTAVRLTGYRSLKPGPRDTMVVAQNVGPLLRYRISTGKDTIDLSKVSFSAQHTGAATTFVSTSPAVTISYEPMSDGYRTAVHGTVGNAPPGSVLIIDLPGSLRSTEADTLDDLRHLAYGYRVPLRDVTSIPFSKLDTVIRADTGAMQWVSVRDKYWLIALMRPVSEGPGGAFRGLTMIADTAVGRIRRTAAATTTQPLTNGQFAFELYVGPQSWQQLHALGNELENVNPYAGLLHGLVQPFATMVMRVLLWMKATFHVNYGWVLVLFGLTIRLALWPLNQKAMRTSIQMQRLQPELTELQKRYKSDPDKQREELVKLYQSHGMSPLSPMLGCLPMLLPMPVLFALYFVFQNTIEFRDVSFLWLPDISLRDPYYITPLVMGASMFLLSWIGMRSAPPNPQTKMMSYMMPVMFTFMFLNFAAGLNLYYAVQNIAALPQQWLLSRSRAKAAGTIGTSPAPAKRSG